MNGDAPASVASDSAGAEGSIPIPPKTAEQKLARKNELKAKSTLLLAIPDEHLLKFHRVKDAKSLWEATKSMFGGNKESKKMQKIILKQQYENFAASRYEGLNKTYDRFQKLISQLEIHGEVISREDANLKLLRSLPSAWNNIALIMHDTSSTNKAVNIAHDLPTTSLKGQASSSTYADDVMFSFFANQSNSLQLDNEDLEEIDTDDHEEMDLKWQVAMLTMRIKGFIKKTRRNLNLNGKEIVGFNKTKVECYNCHKRCHFARECRVPRNQGNKNGDHTRRIVPVETPVNALVVTDGMGYDWSYQAEEGPTDFALMAHLSSSSSSSSSSNTEVRDNSITELKNQLAEALREKDDLKLKLEKFKTLSMKLTKLINSQISFNNKSGVGFDSQMNENELHDCHLNKSEVFKSASDSIPPPYTGNYMPSRPDLSFAGLEDSVYKTNMLGLVLLSLKNENTRKSVIEQHTIRQAENLRKSQSSRVAKRNWNGMMTQNLGDGFEFKKKTCLVCGSLNHLIKDCNFYENKLVGKSVLNNKAVATKSGQVPVNTAKQSSPRAAASTSTARPVNNAAPRPKVNDTLPIKYSYFKAHSPARRPFNQKSAAKTNNFNEKVNTIAVKNATTAGPKAVVNTAEGKRENVVKSSACWIWRPTGKVIDHISKDSGSYMLKRFDYVDPQGRLKHMTGNKSYLTDYQDIDGGFVAFAGSPKGGKITSKGKIRTKKLDFEDVYFIKELKFNLFSVSQMCDKKNSVLFTEIECLILSPDFKLLDKSQVLLKVPRHDNMYSFDLKNVVPSGGLTCLIAKATIDESNLWHRRLDHINFKNMNKLMRGNLVRGIKREFSVARTPQQNRVAERKNRTLIEAARTMLADLLLPTTFGAEAVNTACYVQNRALVTKPHNKTPYELLLGRPSSISFIRPFRCHVTILNTLDPLGKFDVKADEEFLVGYSINSKAFRVFNTKTRKVEENPHINFLENKPNVAGSGLEWLFDIDSLTKSMNYEPVTAGNKTNGDAVILSDSSLYLSTQSSEDAVADDAGKKPNEEPANEGERNEGYANNTNRFSTVNPSVSAAGQDFDNADDQERIDSRTQDVNTVEPSINTASENINTGSPNINTASPIPNDPNMQSLEATGIFDDAYDDREEMGA
ncbi:ribonuclease H-like domain-containing protein [Tanacetum coccineum]